MKKITFWTVKTYRKEMNREIPLQDEFGNTTFFIRPSGQMVSFGYSLSPSLPPLYTSIGAKALDSLERG
ncbi:hypothetical protein ACDQ55_16450 [Chitinophaga sp. 30R24]|uniref:hypothetical protein n=1 Tax=Chitinophaga sp. 30R24 TaxID=3248838 RepID=UPI003B8F572C